MRERVYVLHGIWRTSRHMRSLTRVLNHAGFDAVALDYPSTREDLSALADHVWQQIALDMPTYERVHFVGYSMGGLVLRAMLRRYKPNNIGRVLQLATPNHGSEVADWLQHNRIYKAAYGKAGQQLVTSQGAIADLLGVPDYELGVIAGSFTIDPICYLIIPGANDGKVSVASTKIEPMADHIVLPASHTFFPQNRRVQAQAIHFLQTGRFKR